MRKKIEYILEFVCGPLTSRLIKPLLQNDEPRNKRDLVRGLRQTITGTLDSVKKKRLNEYEKLQFYKKLTVEVYDIVLLFSNFHQEYL